MGGLLEREARFQPSYFAGRPEIEVCGLHSGPPAGDALRATPAEARKSRPLLSIPGPACKNLGAKFDGLLQRRHLKPKSCSPQLTTKSIAAVAKHTAITATPACCSRSLAGTGARCVHTVRRQRPAGGR
jgi:hypothetical protein